MPFDVATRLDPAAPLAPRAAWEATCDAFVGRSLESEAFDVDGRDDDHEVVWQAPVDSEPFWENGDGYAIHLASDPDWEPETLLLLDPVGLPCGFYSGGESWIDPPHRGRGLGVEMVLAMTTAMGRGPIDIYQDGMGFSPAGLGMHRKAWCVAVARAVEDGHEVAPSILAEAGRVREALRTREGPAGGMVP